MSPRDYPLHALRKLREQEKADAEARLNACIRVVAEAARALDARQQKTILHNAETSRISNHESTLPASGHAMQQRAGWLTKRRSERAALLAEEVKARAACRDAEREEQHARLALIEAEAALLAVEKRHAAWARSEKAKADDAADDEAADRLASRSSSNLP